MSKWNGQTFLIHTKILYLLQKKKKKKKIGHDTFLRPLCNSILDLLFLQPSWWSHLIKYKWSWSCKHELWLSPLLCCAPVLSYHSIHDSSIQYDGNVSNGVYHGLKWSSNWANNILPSVHSISRVFSLSRQSSGLNKLQV